MPCTLSRSLIEAIIKVPCTLYRPRTLRYHLLSWNYLSGTNRVFSIFSQTKLSRTFVYVAGCSNNGWGALRIITRMTKLSGKWKKRGYVRASYVINTNVPITELPRTRDKITQRRVLNLDYHPERSTCPLARLAVLVPVVPVPRPRRPRTRQSSHRGLVH